MEACEDAVRSGFNQNVCIGSLPFGVICPSRAISQWRLLCLRQRIEAVVADKWILPASPLDSILLAVLTCCLRTKNGEVACEHGGRIQDSVDCLLSFSVDSWLESTLVTCRISKYLKATCGLRTKVGEVACEHRSRIQIQDSRP